jgi:endoribonuclease LACTB2
MKVHERLSGPVEDVYRRVRQGVGPARSAEIAAAAAAVLWRSRGHEREVYLVRRSPSLPFLGGFWSFPGGGVEPADREREVPGARGEEAAAIAACIRELEEETGVSVPLDAAALWPAGRWETPPFSPIRFDARYYAVACPEGAEPDAARSGGELVEGAWLTPGEALASWRLGERLIPPPVLAVLRALDAGWERLGERLAEVSKDGREGPRIWTIVPGIASLPLRTPTLPPATHTNCYALGEGELLIVDPGSPYDDEREVLDEAVEALRAGGARPVAVALTHHHADHVGGARYLAERHGLPIWAHAETAARIGGADWHLEDGERLELAGGPGGGARAIDVVLTPGHAPGHLCFVDATTRYAVVGDMVASVGTIVVDPDEGDMAAYLDSLARLRALNLRALLPAHGGPIPDVQAKLDAYRAHRLWREQKLERALASEPRPIDALVRDVYDDVPAALWPLAERSLLAHLVKLEREGRASPSDGGWRSNLALG